MAEGGFASADVGSFHVETNSGETSEQLQARLKPQIDKATSEAASQLGKRGAQARADKAEKPEAAEDATDVQVEQTEGEEKPKARQIKPIPDKKVDKEEAPTEAKSNKDKGEVVDKETDTEKPKDKRGDPRHDPNARIREATREAAEAKRIAAEERKAREALEARLAAIERGEQPKPEAKPKDGKPDANDFATYDEYLDARDAYNREQWTKDVQERIQSVQARQAEVSSLEQAVGRFREAAATVADQISEDVGNLRTTFQLAQGEQESGENWLANELVFSPENAPALMLHFSAHPDELQRIAALSTPRAVSREMAKLEARLEAATTANEPSAEREKPVSKATPPVRQVTGAPYVAERDSFRPGMTLDEYAKVWNKQRIR